MLNRFDALVDNEYQEHYREMSFMSEFHSKAQQFWASKLAQVKIALESINGMTITVCD